MVLPLPGAPIVHVSPTEDADLFQASLCGLGATGVMIEIEIEVEEAYRLRETKQSRGVTEVINSLDEIKRSAEHVRIWWYPDGEGMVVGKADRTYQVSFTLFLLDQLTLEACPTIKLAASAYPWIPYHAAFPLYRSLLHLLYALGREMGVLSR
jgi:hypothetical protein